jgi:hypothetical protein
LLFLRHLRHLISRFIHSFFSGVLGCPKEGSISRNSVRVVGCSISAGRSKSVVVGFVTARGATGFLVAFTGATLRGAGFAAAFFGAALASLFSLAGPSGARHVLSSLLHGPSSARPCARTLSSVLSWPSPFSRHAFLSPSVCARAERLRLAGRTAFRFFLVAM